MSGVHSLPPEIRRMIRTTNATNTRYQRVIRARSHFPDETTTPTYLYLLTRSPNQQQQDTLGSQIREASDGRKASGGRETRTQRHLRDLSLPGNPKGKEHNLPSSSRVNCIL